MVLITEKIRLWQRYFLLARYPCAPLHLFASPLQLGEAM